jgi:hypothetical protein
MRYEFFSVSEMAEVGTRAVLDLEYKNEWVVKVRAERTASFFSDTYNRFTARFRFYI